MHYFSLQKFTSAFIFIFTSYMVLRCDYSLQSFYMNGQKRNQKLYDVTTDASEFLVNLEEYLFCLL